MAIEWFINQPGLGKGPYTAGEVKQLASNSQIDVETPIRKGTDGSWVKASQIKGLFGPDGQPVNVAVESEPSPQGERPTETNDVTQELAALPEKKQDPFFPDVDSSAINVPIPNASSAPPNNPSTANQSANQARTSTPPSAPRIPLSNQTAATYDSASNVTPPAAIPAPQVAASYPSNPHVQRPPTTAAYPNLAAGQHANVATPYKSKTTAAVLAIIPLTGALGIHDFYLGKTGMGVAKNY